MSDTWQDMEDEERMLAEDIFVALEGARDLTERAAAGSSEARLNFAELVAFANDPQSRMTAELAQALLRQPDRRRDLDRLLRLGSRAQFPRVAAAASGEIELREAGPYRIRILSSHASEGQSYVIIELPDGVPAPEMLVVLRPDIEPVKLALTAPQAGQIQVLTGSDSALIQGLRDIASEIVLR